MRDGTTTQSNSKASHRAFPKIVLVAMSGMFSFIPDHRAIASGKFSEHLETSLASLIDEFPNHTRTNPAGPRCHQSIGHQLEYFCAAALACSNVFVFFNDTRIFYIAHISGPENDCSEQNYFAQVAGVVKKFFDMDFEAASQITDEMRRGAFRYSQGERKSELMNKDTAKGTKFGDGIGSLTVSYEKYPAEYLKRYQFRWDGVGK